MSEYLDFLASKRVGIQPTGFEVAETKVNPALFPFQRDVVRWACRKGRAAVFLDTGLGKTLVQLEWARLMGGRTLIVAPLSVARQTVNEARNKLSLDVRYVRSQSQVEGAHTFYITNYEMVSQFDAAQFNAVVLDESSILKSLDGKRRLELTRMFANTPYRLCCTATPAPNDITEIGRHAEFLGVMTNAEMLAMFFVNDQKMKDGTYRLKGHATERFYQWLSSWGIAIKRPSDIGYSDEGYVLPPLSVDMLTVASDYTPAGMLPGFVGDISAIEAKRVRRATTESRVAKTAELVNGNAEQWVIWAGLNDEADALATAIADSINVHGSLSPDEKATALERFVNGNVRVLITKTSIAGFGINMQCCHNTVFCGIDYSWESYYQAVRRFYRFGQKEPVQVYVVTSAQEQQVFEAVLSKEKEAVKMTDEMVERSANYSKGELADVQANDWTYKTDEAGGENWRLLLGDSCERIDELGDSSIDLSVFSPPFVSLYTYTPTERDLGNSRTEDEFFKHFQPIIDGLLRVTKSGRNCCVHVQQVAAFKARDGYIGIKDFRGDVIRAFTAQGWIFHGEVTIDKNPQAQAIRTKTKGLMFAQLHKDSSANRPAFADYLLIFQKPGENAVPVVPDVNNDEWIQWAHPVWYDINETDVLNVAVARADRDERHMCALQLPFIERCVRLYSNKNETVFSPFAGIGSEGYEAVRLGRKFTGIELKEEYWRVAANNLREAERQSHQVTLWDLLPAEVQL